MTPRRLALASALAISAAAPILLPLTATAETCAPVEVQNVRAGQGALMLAAYDSAPAFRQRAVVQMQLRPDQETMTFTVCIPTGSTVSLTLYQDLNSNGRLDASVLGIPTEPYGSSGTPASFGPPTWEATNVPMAAGSAIVVRMSK